ncbi:hypothetical protein K2Q08_03740, partial [Patescibacteria group bacterium]|nr:hypothetical protein [Patescibacteria group bacterium]
MCIMERDFSPIAAPVSFASPEAEFEHLGKRMQQLEAQLKEKGVEEPKQEAAMAAVVEHHNALPEEVRVEHVSEDAVHLPLSPESHDEKMAELIGVLAEKGAWKAMAQAEATRSPHVIDDFHRILSVYLSEGYGAKGLSRGSTLYRQLSMVLYQVTLPQPSKEEGAQKPLKDLLSAMEHFYQGMQAIPKGTDEAKHFVFEIANPVGSESTVAYMAIPKAATELFEKQLAAVFPKARIERRPDDYNVFSETGFTIGSTGRFSRVGIFALKSYVDFEHDPIGALLAAFGKLDREHEGAMVQFLMLPEDRGMSHEYRRALDRMAQGISLQDATNLHTGVFGGVYGAFKEFFFPAKKHDLSELRLDSDPRVKAIERKVASPLFQVGIRLVASAGTPERAASILTALEGSFKQYGDTA